MVAVWEHVGVRLNADGPYLRIAIWEDGRIIFAKYPQSAEPDSPDSDKQLSKKQRGNKKTAPVQNQGARGPRWTHELYEGSISAEEVAKLKEAIAATGVLDLKRTSALVPDAPIDCMLVDFGNRRQLLLWDERESPNYGINIDPTPDDLRFIAAWKAVNRLALAARPKKSEPFTGRFAPPDSWGPWHANEDD